MDVTRDTLAEIGAGDIPVLYVFNKSDIVQDQQKEASQLVMEVPRTIDDRAYIYAKSKESLDALIDLIEETLKRGDTLCELLIPYSDGGVLNTITSTSTVESTEYLPEGVKVIAHLSAKNAQKYAEFISPS